MKLNLTWTACAGAVLLFAQALVIAVAVPVLYNNKHLPHAIFAGPGSKPEGIEALRKEAWKLSKDADIVLYCGCCPMEKCPNIRPAYSALKEMGFTRIRVLHVPTSMATDWFDKGYPSELGSALKEAAASRPCRGGHPQPCAGTEGY